MMGHLIKRAALGMIVLVGIVAALVLTIMVYQGHRLPKGNPAYVSLGSSFAAGLGLGDRVPGSPWACQRSVGGYPQRIARATGLALVDMTCSGSTAEQVINGGQFFQGPQLAAVTAQTELVTVTTGGNDIAYISDLIGMGYQNRGGLIGSSLSLLMKAPHTEAARNIAKVRADIEELLQEAKRRAPSAKIVVATYPAVMPPVGTCSVLGLTAEQAASMRAVADELADATRAAARATGAMLVDIAVISQGHDACSAIPWVNGLTPEHGAPFHPTVEGAEAVAAEIIRAAALAASGIKLTELHYAKSCLI